MKNKGLIIILIIFLSLIISGLIFFMVYALNNRDMDFSAIKIFSSTSNKLVDEREFNSNNLNISGDYVDVYIEESNRDNIKVEIYSEKYKDYNLSEDSSGINVVLNDGRKFSSFFRKSSNIRIYVPVEYSKNIVTDLNAGDLKIGNLEYASLSSKASAGDVKVQKLNNANISLQAGDIKINTINSLICKTKAGDIKIDSINSLNATTSFGDIKIENLSGDIEASTNAGDIKINRLSITKDSKIKTKTGDIKINSTNEIYVDAKNNIGDIKIKNNYRKSNIVLYVESNIGDIRVGN